MSRDCYVALPRGVCLQFVIVVFPDHIHLLFLTHMYTVNSRQMFILTSQYYVEAGSEITPYIKIDKPLVVYRFW